MFIHARSLPFFLPIVTVSHTTAESMLQTMSSDNKTAFNTQTIMLQLPINPICFLDPHEMLRCKLFGHKLTGLHI